MKKQIKTMLLTIAVLLCSISAKAASFEVDGIYYNITSETDLMVKVTYRGKYSYSYANEYSGSVVIPEMVTYGGKTYSVTSIGDDAFYGCYGLTSITIGNSVISIGESAFTECSGLTSITIPNSVISIGIYAFSGCSGLTSITIPNSVTSIGSGAFSGCSGLTSITIPNSVTSIGSYAFSGCSGLTSITIPNSVTSIGSGAFSGCSGLTSITIPNSVTSIGSYAFSGCSGLTSITIPNSVTSIGSGAFYNCYNLTSITIPNSVTYIEDEAFLGCEALKSVINFSDLIIGEGSTSHGYVGCYANEVINVDGQIGDYLFRKYNSDNYYLCKYLGIDTILVLPNDYKGMNYKIDSRVFKGYSNLISITIPNSVTSIGDETFEGCSSLTSITIPNSVTSIGNETFEGCSSLTSITIGNSVTFIGYDAFEGCSSLTAVHITDLDAWYKISFYCFRSNPLRQANHLYLNGEEIKDLVIPNSVTSIGNYAFWGCYGLTSVTIPNSVTSIGDEAFWGCYDLTSVTIPNSVTSIGDYAFSYCYGLTSITVDENNTTYDSRDNCNGIINTGSNSLVIGCKLTVIPNSVTSIGDDAFYGCSDLTSITIPNSVTSIGEHAFSGCTGLKLVINFSDLNIEKGFTSHGNVALYASKVINADEQIGDFFFKTIDGNHYLSGYIGNDTDLTLPQDYKGEKYIIGDDAFYECSGLTSITIPNSVTSIGDYAFRDCSGLTSITIPNSVTSIGDYAFRDCSGLTSVTIGNSVTSIGDYAFAGCSGLKLIINSSDLTIEKGSTSHGYVAKYASKVINADEQVGDFFFKTINSVHHLNGYLGNGGNLKLPQDYKGEKYSIGSSAFRGCSGLTSITIPNSVTGIGRYAFSACTGLTNITIGNSVQNIEYGAFYNCTGLTSITIPNSVISIGSYKEGNNTTSAFSGCNQLTKLIIEDGYMYIDLGYSQFIDCPLEYVYIGRNHSYTNNPFKEGNTLKTAIIGSKVNKIGNYLFRNCTGLTSVTIPSSVTVIGKYTFDGCSSLTDITIPNSVMSIEYYAFNNCSALKDLYIGNSVTSLPNGLLSGCSALEKLYIGTSVTSIADNLLTGCTNLNTLSVGAKIPPTVNDLGLGSQQYFTVKLQVPEGSKAMYQFADAWKKFFNIEEFDPATGIAEVTPDAEEKNLPIYNLQGVKMTGSKEYLPAGIYIQGGKKMIVR